MIGRRRVKVRSRDYKNSRMHRSPNFLTHVAALHALRVGESSAISVN